MNGDEVDFIDVFILSPSQIVTLSKRFTVRSDSFMEQQNLVFADGITVTNFHYFCSFIPIELNAAIITSHN